jgi:hypothetical protein
MACDAKPGTPAEEMVFEQPESFPRWYVIRCNGTARVRIGAHVFLQGYQTLDDREFQSRLEVMTAALTHDGSAYVVNGPEFGPDFVRLSGKVRGITGATWRVNPLLIPTGKYELKLQCTGVCGPGAIELFPIPATDWAGALGAEFERRSGISGAVVKVALGPNHHEFASSIDVSGGIYQVLLIGLEPQAIDSVTIGKLPNLSAEVKRVPALTQTEIRAIPAGTIIAINQAPGPWSVQDLTGNHLHLQSADLLGSAYFANGAESQVSMVEITRLSWLGAVVSLLVLVFLFGSQRLASLAKRLSRSIGWHPASVSGDTASNSGDDASRYTPFTERSHEPVRSVEQPEDARL